MFGADDSANGSGAWGLTDRSLLVVDSETSLRPLLIDGLSQRGFDTSEADSIAAAIRQLATTPPAFAVIDVKLSDGSGIDVVKALKRRRPGATALILTRYASIPTVIAGIRAGAVDYLCKPTAYDELSEALLAGAKGQQPEAPRRARSPDRVRWEHICAVHSDCGHNVSRTAKRLSMHRRTLQRILSRPEPT